MTLKRTKLLLVAAVVLTAFTAGATATTADASVNAQPITDDVTQSIDIVLANDPICDMSGVSVMCGSPTCPNPLPYYC
ncbi:hypothetical protein [Halorussus pelagicus]|uniref:hypothetical protein n=1 Tax=Halorussus pelagicus TaxID=2505977 RepID=UPI000FFC115A|nr:hypothetical protein [Halorussus pelagicus]